MKRQVAPTALNDTPLPFKGICKYESMISQCTVLAGPALKGTAFLNSKLG